MDRPWLGPAQGQALDIRGVQKCSLPSTLPPRSGPVLIVLSFPLCLAHFLHYDKQILVERPQLILLCGTPMTLQHSIVEKLPESRSVVSSPGGTGESSGWLREPLDARAAPAEI